MYTTNHLIYLELQKTGGTHICSLLDRYVGGEMVGKHHRLKQDSDKHIIGSIRNPWDWYVSLWAYGVGGKGAIRHRSCRGFDLKYYHYQLPHEMGKHWLTLSEFLQMSWHDLGKPVQRWQQSYADHQDPECFRAWLAMIMNVDRRYDFGEGYAFTPLCRHAGLLTYRYFRLYTKGDAVYRNTQLADACALTDFDSANNICSSMIRTDRLVEDFIAALDAAGSPLDSGQQQQLRDNDSERTNSSKRKDVGHYYDQRSIDLVAQRDAYLIDKYDFQPPAL